MAVEHCIDYRTKQAGKRWFARPMHRAELERNGIYSVCDKRKCEVPFALVDLGRKRRRACVALQKGFSADEAVLKQMFAEAEASGAPILNDDWIECVGPGVAYIPNADRRRHAERKLERQARGILQAYQQIIEPLLPRPPRAIEDRRLEEGRQIELLQRS